MNPLVSIFLPTRNRVNLFKQSLDSILNTCNKDNLNFEIIVKVDLDDF
jgi:glycosyltransferase involved in cell wall biosynthesis